MACIEYVKKYFLRKAFEGLTGGGHHSRVGRKGLEWPCPVRSALQRPSVDHISFNMINHLEKNIRTQPANVI